jgi:hypothetical protein
LCSNNSYHLLFKPKTKYPDSSLHLETNMQLDSFLLEAVNGAVSKVGKRISPIRENTKDNFRGREFKIKHSKYRYMERSCPRKKEKNCV